MSLTIEQVLDDAKRLVDRLRDHDNAADSLIEQSTTLNKRIEAMKQYQEDVEEMNSVARHRPRSALILGIQQENRQIRELQRENRELRVALEEHQSALDLIMSSYREQVCRMLMANRFDRDCLEKHAEYRENSMASTAKIIEMAAVMKQAIELEEKSSFNIEQQLTRLQVENRGLRELLEISRAVHFPHSPSNQEEKRDKEKDPKSTIVINREGANNLSESKSPPPKKDQSTKTNSGTGSETLANDSKDVGNTKARPVELQDADEQGVFKRDTSSTGTVGGDKKGDDAAQGEGAIDLEVENVLNDFADLTASLDIDEDGEESEA
ncbi:FGFR1 oncogene partner 2 homolog [Acanthaster planci]|uniref:FGFR1 oncogene partner 2 homolog n=1 Tax=Acanthaster planci TaxID=133434 RepID=A0A8B7XV99_ACAPL|nr:FGFR1 oncogene partner 2 homolog [Acanthaster planci]XP_022083807.1 FGFR1 oncogene partner 2 homolog [Acanthaster planci]